MGSDEWMLVAIGGAVVVCIFVVRVMRTAALNQDPMQQELAMLLLEYAQSPRGESNELLLGVSSQRLFISGMILEEREQKSRFVHALTLARPHMTGVQYEHVRLVLRAAATI